MGICKNHRGVQRESNFELLRLLCIIGILMMHTFSGVYGKVSGANLIYGTLINSLCNTGVSLFVLISGYFGIKSRIKKIVGIELTTIFYSFATLAVQYVCGSPVTAKDIFQSCFPISSGMYWYITSYMLLLVFADYINLIPERLNKKDFQKLIFIMLLIFSVFPSVIQIHIMKDSGKGILNMLLVYLIGRYIKKYDIRIQKMNRAVIFSISVLIMEFVINYSLALIRGGVGVYAPFARDCSVFIIFLSVMIFLLFREINITSTTINALAKNVIGIYLFEGAIRTVIASKFDVVRYIDKWYLFAVITAVVLILHIN